MNEAIQKLAKRPQPRTVRGRANVNVKRRGKNGKVS